MTKWVDVTWERVIKNNKFFLLLTLLLSTVAVSATDLGEMQLRSNLGEALRANVPIQGLSPNLMVASCFRSKIETVEGVLLAKPHIGIGYAHTENNPVQIKLTTTEIIAEPAVRLTLELICGGHMVRVYPLLLDYVEIAAPAAGIELAELHEPDEAQPAQSKTSLLKPADLQPEASQNSVASAGKVPRHNAKPARPKSNGNLALRFDALKISNEEFHTPVEASGTPQDQAGQTLEQQRLAANKSAQTAFAKMMRDQPSQMVTQEDLLQEQQRVQNLEKELLHLKLELGLKDQKQQTLPNLLIILNVVVLLLFAVVVTVLVVMLRKARRAEKQNWSAGSFERRNTRREELEPQEPEPHRLLPEQETDQSVPRQEPEIRLNETAGPENIQEKTTLPPYAFNLFANREGQSIHIEEISDALQEAEFWLSLKDPQRAIEILEPQSLNDHPSTPVMWLLLLDLYRMTDNAEKYNQLRLRFKQKFNSNILEYGQSPNPDTIKFLCDYEHLTGKLTAFWNTNYILPFLESLLVDDREGERVGFELSVYQDILMLIAISKELERPEVKLHIAVE